jgi:hypothetical protein
MAVVELLHPLAEPGQQGQQILEAVAEDAALLADQQHLAEEVAGLALSLFAVCHLPHQPRETPR